ncbi:MAG: TolC family protein [Sphingomonas bacterium]|uniref:TolC family protein n=1 Tax=Sphingomonas bacterium TaxID=1895847 RepID=UPI002606FE5D|nr:TolC family protein [Sphingomonas bacterium]MDB5694914.1 TolC family protein [Sphingomonas bacterium]
MSLRSLCPHACARALLLLAPAGVLAQVTPPSLVEAPQRGATPPAIRPDQRPLPTPTQADVEPRADLPVQRPLAVPSTPAVQGPLLSQPPVSRVPLLRQRPGGLPAPSEEPFGVDLASDPVLRIAAQSTSAESFRAAIAAAVARNPRLGEATAQADEAEAIKNEALARQQPSADIQFTHFRIVDRAFSNDPLNLLERSRPSKRTDATARVNQPLFDFGAGNARVRASRQRVRQAAAGIDDAGAQVALDAIGAWYNVFGYRALVRLGEAFAADQADLRRAVDTRIAQGAAAAGDVAQVDSYRAAAEAQLVDFRRALAGAEARYRAQIGEDPPADIGHPPAPVIAGEPDLDRLPAVRAAAAGAAAAREDARAARSDTLPQLGAAISAGRYGVFETARDFDIRADLTVSWRLFGGTMQRVDQAAARATGATARLDRTRLEARRDADISRSDLQALFDAEAALKSNYIASRRSRDVLAERFRVSRGTLFDLLGAESNYFGVAARYIQTTIELDTARYVLLARTGQLLPALGIEPAAEQDR